MKKLWIPALAGMTLWAAMTLAEAALEMTPPSQAAQSTYDYTVIAEFAPSGDLTPSLASDAPVITNDGTVVYSAGVPPSMSNNTLSEIFSGDGTVPRLISGWIWHSFDAGLTVDVSGNGLLVTNLTGGTIIDVHDGTVVGEFSPLPIGMGGFITYDVSINNRGSVAYTAAMSELCQYGYIAEDGVFRDDGETTTTIALTGVPAVMTAVRNPSINEKGQVAFVVHAVLTSIGCPVTPGIEPGDLYVGDGTRLVKIADTISAPSLNNRGDVGFIGLNNGGWSVLVSDGKKTRIIADTSGPFDSFAGSTSSFPEANLTLRVGASLNDRGDVAFQATLDNGVVGIFTGPDVVKNKVIAVGDSLARSSVTEIRASRQMLNNNGQIAFQATLADGRKVIVRAEPKKPGLN